MREAIIPGMSRPSKRTRRGQEASRSLRVDSRYEFGGIKIREKARSHALTGTCTAHVGRARDPEVLDTLAAAYGKQGRFADALHAATRAFEMATAAPRAALAGRVQARNGHPSNGAPVRELGGTGK